MQCLLCLLLVKTKQHKKLSKVCLENDWNSKANDFLILERRSCYSAENYWCSFGPQKKLKQRSALELSSYRKVKI